MNEVAQHSEIQKTLDVLLELDMEIKANEESPWFAGMRGYLTKYPTWPIVVDGSIVEPITDEGRLLG